MPDQHRDGLERPSSVPGAPVLSGWSRVPRACARRPVADGDEIGDDDGYRDRSNDQEARDRSTPGTELEMHAPSTLAGAFAPLLEGPESPRRSGALQLSSTSGRGRPARA